MSPGPAATPDPPAAEPATELDARYSSSEADATTWASAREVVTDAELFWLSTVRPDGRPHVTPLLAVWVDDALWFCTGADERKATNLTHNVEVCLTTGVNRMAGGLDVVVEGQAEHVRDETLLGRVAAAYLDKYGEEWRFEVRDRAFAHGDGGAALVFRVTPTTAFGFAKDPYGQTRWRFAPGRASPSVTR